MNWKALLALFLIVVIAGLVFATDIGRNYANFLRIRIGNFVSGLFEFAPFAARTEGGFRMILSADKDSFNGQSYRVSNSSLNVSGICQGPVELGNLVLHKSDMRCGVRVGNLAGSFEFTAGGSALMDGSASVVVVDGDTYTPSEGSLRVKAEVIPVEGLLLTDLTQGEISLPQVTGNLKRFNPDGSLKATVELTGEDLRIGDFAGSLKLYGSTVELSGSAGSIAGETFNW